MFTVDFVPGFVMGIREGLEAFLIIVIMLEYLNKANRKGDKKYVYQGLLYGIVASLVFGGILYLTSMWLNNGNTNIAKLWEFGASFVALALITTFIFFMIRHKDSIVSEINGKMQVSLKAKAIILLALVMVAREGAEVVLFVFASVDKVSYGLGALSGVLLSAGIVYLIYKSLIKVNLKVIFNITLVYLILQAGFLLGYSFHELFSYFKDVGVIDSGHWIYTKLFDVSSTFLHHKTAPIGIALYALIGWYSKPEVFQFVIQYGYTVTLLVFFVKSFKKAS